MKIRQISTPCPRKIRPTTSVQRAARLMRDLDVRVLPVVVDGGECVGTLTDRDIATRAAANGLDAGEATVREVMTRTPFSCLEDSDARSARLLMRKLGLQWLPIIDERGELRSLLDRGSVA